MSLLLRLQAAQHVRRHQDHALLSDMKPLRIFLPIDSDFHVIGDFTALIDDGPFDDTRGTNLNMRQDHGPVDAGALIDSHIGEQQR